MGLVLSLEGYSDKLLDFAKTFVDLTLSCADENGIDAALLTNSLEKQHKKYKNANVDVDMRCNNNRLLYLMPDWHHAIHMESLLKDSWKDQECPSELNPSVFLRDRILNRIS